MLEKYKLNKMVKIDLNTLGEKIIDWGFEIAFIYTILTITFYVFLIVLFGIGFLASIAYIFTITISIGLYIIIVTVIISIIITIMAKIFYKNQLKNE